MNAEDICPGDVLGGYELLVPIAKGGTAEVWVARSKGTRDFENLVAIKVMLGDLADELDAETMFFDEARVVSRIRHPNVAQVLDLGETETALFIVMEWIDGEPINVIAREARRRGGVPIPIVVYLIRQACNGLHAAHEAEDETGRIASVIHRDVSPQNILVGYDGVVKMIDFGVAKAASNQQRTNVGQLKGKVAYMAPEQAYGEPVDRRTDVFGLGIVFYQLVTGKHPFRGDNEFATLARIRDKRPADSPSVHVPTIPPMVEWTILKALAKSPADRFPSMIEFASALDQAYASSDFGIGEISVFMNSILGVRGERKRLAIHDAIQAVEEHRAQSSVPDAFELGHGEAQWTTGPLDRSQMPGLNTGVITGEYDRPAIPAPPASTPGYPGAAFSQAGSQASPGLQAGSQASPGPQAGWQASPGLQAGWQASPGPQAGWQASPGPQAGSQANPGHAGAQANPWAAAPRPPPAAELSSAPAVERVTGGSNSLLPGQLIVGDPDPPSVAIFKRRRRSRSLFVAVAIAAIFVAIGLLIWGATFLWDAGANPADPSRRPW